MKFGLVMMSVFCSRIFFALVLRHAAMLHSVSPSWTSYRAGPALAFCFLRIARDTASPAAATSKPRAGRSACAGWEKMGQGACPLRERRDGRCCGRELLSWCGHARGGGEQGGQGEGNRIVFAQEQRRTRMSSARLLLFPPLPLAAGLAGNFATAAGFCGLFFGVWYARSSTRAWNGTPAGHVCLSREPHGRG